MSFRGRGGGFRGRGGGKKMEKNILQKFNE